MTLNVQNDAGSVSDANGYIDRAFLDSYLADRGIILTQTDDEKDAAVVKATDLIDFKFADQFVGTKKSLEQTTQWPRDNAINSYGFDVSDSIPEALKKSCAEYAYLSATGVNISPNPEYDTTGQSVKRKKVKVDVIETETEYKDDYNSNAAPSFPKAEAILSSLLDTSSGMVKQVVRA
jgi:hypothetical protein